MTPLGGRQPHRGQVWPRRAGGWLPWPCTVRGVPELVGVVGFVLCVVLFGAGVVWCLDRFLSPVMRRFEESLTARARPTPMRAPRGSPEEVEARRAAGLADTDHTVEIVELPPGDDAPLLIALCADTRCLWGEFSEANTASGEQEQEEALRVAAAKHGATVLPGMVRLGEP